MNQDNELQKIDLFPLIRAAIKQFRRSWWVLLILLVLTGSLGYYQAKRSYKPMYRVHASFVVTAGDPSLVTSDYQNKITTDQLNSTFPYILTSGALGQVVAADLGVDSVPGTVSVNPLGSTNLFQIVVTGEDPQMVSKVLNSVITNYPRVAKYILGTTQLSLVEQSPVPDAPYNSPQTRHQAGRAMVIGLAIYLLILLLQITTNRTIRGKRMLMRYTSLPYMGSIPKIRMPRKSRAERIHVEDDKTPSGYQEVMEAIQSRILRKIRSDGLKSIYVTSSLAGEGKTTVACNLSVLMAQHGYRVLLIDGDLRNPSVDKGMGLNREPGAPGFAELLRGDLALSKAIIPMEDMDLFVIPGGKPVGRIGNLFDNGRFDAILRKLEQQVDLVIVDTPPCAFIHDAATIANHLDGGFLVIRQDYAPIDRILAGIELLARTKAPLFGCAMNFSDEHHDHYGYGYGRYGRYGHYGKYGKYGKYGNGKYGYGEEQRESAQAPEAKTEEAKSEAKSE